MAAAPDDPRRLRDKAREQIRQIRDPSPEWNAHQRAAWEKVDRLAAQTPPLTFTEAEPLRALAIDTVHTVAGHFRPGSARPEADITMPELLLLTERVARDLRLAALQVPGSQSIRVGQILSVGRAAGRYGPWAQAAYKAGDLGYNLLLSLTNPAAGAARFARGYIAGSTTDLGKQWMLAYGTGLIVRKVGRAAIDLYAGQLRLSDEELAKAAEADAALANRIETSWPRILVAGQVNAGKSSLVNALAGEVLCEVRAVPVPAAGMEHILAVDGQDVAIIVEAHGLTAAAGAQAATIEAAQDSDLIVWVTSATQPGRAADVAALTELRKRHDADLHRRPPPILVALTHVDQLPPAAEWNPPYNTLEPESPKERVIRRAMESVAKTLAVELDTIVPVAVPDATEPWNTEFLWGCIAARLDDAKYRQLSRLRQSRTGWSWAEVAGQAATLMGHAARSASQLAGKFSSGAGRD